MKQIAKPYSPLAKSLHWIVALLIYVNFAIGFYMHSLGFSIARARLIGIHKSIGVIILMLAIVRYVLTLFRRNAQRFSHLPHIKKIIRISHSLLYVLLFTLPISGIVMSMSLGYYVGVFDLVSIPPLFDENIALFHLSHTVHFTAVYILIALLVFHVSIALYHHFIIKDRYLTKMGFSIK